MAYRKVGLSGCQRTLLDEAQVVDDNQQGFSEADPVAVTEQPARTGRLATFIALGVDGDVVDEQLVFGTVALDIGVAIHHVEFHIVLDGVDLFVLILRAGELVSKRLVSNESSKQGFSMMGSPLKVKFQEEKVCVLTGGPRGPRPQPPGCIHSV